MNKDKLKELYQNTKTNIIGCCEYWDDGLDAVVGFCEDCGEAIDENGNCVCGCCYSHIVCKKCGSAPCDGSC